MCTHSRTGQRKDLFLKEMKAIKNWVTERTPDWHDIQDRLQGSSLEKHVKEHANPEQWGNAIKTVAGMREPECTKIWRVEGYIVKEWDSHWGKFHMGDAYIVLHKFLP